MVRQANDVLLEAERIEVSLLDAAAAARAGAAGTGAGGAWPPVSMVDANDRLFVVAALPGARRDDVDVRLEGDRLSLAGRQPLSPCCREGTLLAIESVSFADGLLTVALRKAAA